MAGLDLPVKGKHSGKVPVDLCLAAVNDHGCICLVSSVLEALDQGRAGKRILDYM